MNIINKKEIKSIIFYNIFYNIFFQTFFATKRIIKLEKKVKAYEIARSV